MINKIQRNQRYRGPKESLKFNNDMTEIKVDLKSDDSIITPVSVQTELARKNIEIRQSDTIDLETNLTIHGLPTRFYDVSIIDGNDYTWEGLSDLKLRVRQVTEKIKRLRKSIKGV